MKAKLVCAACLVLAVTLFTGCALWEMLFGTGDPELTEQQVKELFTSIINVNVDTKTAGATGEKVSDTLFRYSATDGTYTCEVDFSQNPIVSSTQSFDGYSPPGSDYVISGDFSGEADSGSSPVTSLATGTFTLTGGDVETLSCTYTVSGTTDDGLWVSATVTGTVTANDKDFSISNWSLGNLAVTNNNILHPYMVDAMGW